MPWTTAGLRPFRSGPRRAADRRRGGRPGVLPTPRVEGRGDPDGSGPGPESSGVSLRWRGGPAPWAPWARSRNSRCGRRTLRGPRFVVGESPGRPGRRLRARRRRSPCGSSCVSVFPPLSPSAHALRTPPEPDTATPTATLRGQRSNGLHCLLECTDLMALTRRPLFASIGGSCVCTCTSPTCFLPDGERHIALADTPPEPKGQGVSSWPGTGERVRAEKARVEVVRGETADDGSG